MQLEQLGQVAPDRHLAALAALAVLDRDHALGQADVLDPELDHKAYPKGVTVSDEDMAALNIYRDTFHGEWNYTIQPHKPENNAVVL